MNLIIILITILCNLPASQFWHAEKITQSFSDKLSLTFEDDFRSESFGENNYYFHGDVGLKYKLSSAIFFNANFREVFENKSSGWVQEHRPHGTVSMKKKIGLISTTGRIRMEYRIKDSGSSFRNRNMVSVDLGSGWTSLKVIPYFADEMFYDLSSNEINRNRFYIGCKIKNLTRFKPTIYFMQQRNLKNNEWDTIGVLGIKISF
jgi:hypothetical protein